MDNATIDACVAVLETQIGLLKSGLWIERMTLRAAIKNIEALRAP